MPTKCCPSCYKPLTFWSVLAALNPANIKCGHCKHTIKIHRPHAVIAIITAAVVSILALVITLSASQSEMALWAVLLALGIALEIIYFVLINKGLIQSDLIDHNGADNNPA